MLEKGTLQIRNYLFYGRDQRNNIMTLPVSLEWWVVMSGWQWVDNIVYVVVQFYPWCKFHFPLFCDMVIMYMYDNEFIKNKGKKLHQGKNWTTTYTVGLQILLLLILPLNILSACRCLLFPLLQETSACRQLNIMGLTFFTRILWSGI